MSWNPPGSWIVLAGLGARYVCPDHDVAGGGRAMIVEKIGEVPRPSSPSSPSTESTLASVDASL
jgi:hypothetical protein